MSLSSASPKSRKLALIIGQNDYQYLDKLVLSKPDAELMHETLQNLGFQTFTPPLIDKTNKELKEAFIRFSTELHAGDLVFFYYSGHANQQTIDNKTDNYIFGIDAKQEIKNGVKITAGIPLHSRILQSWLDETCLYLIVIDACRIFPNKDQKFKAGSKSDQCLGQVQSEMSLIPACLPQDIKHREYDVVYACQPGCGAIEDTDREVGYLASALSNAMKKPGSWNDAQTDVIQQVQMESGYRQKPSVSVNISKKLYFKSCDVSEVSSDQQANFMVPRLEISTSKALKHPLTQTQKPTCDQAIDDTNELAPPTNHIRKSHSPSTEDDWNKLALPANHIRQFHSSQTKDDHNDLSPAHSLHGLLQSVKEKSENREYEAIEKEATELFEKATGCKQQ